MTAEVEGVSLVLNTPARLGTIRRPAAGLTRVLRGLKGRSGSGSIETGRSIKSILRCKCHRTERSERFRLTTMHVEPALIEWLLDSDPALRWQVERDIARVPRDVWEATRTLVATEGFGAQLLALQDSDGQWAGGAFFPKGFDLESPKAADASGQPWLATTWTLNSLREWCLDSAALAGTAERLAVHSRWEYDNLP